MTDYFDRVEQQLVRNVETVYPAVREGPAGTGSSGSVRRSSVALTTTLVGAGLGGLGGLILAILMSFGAASPASDRLVVRARSGLVTITASTVSNIPALNARLASLGIPIRVARVRPQCVAPVRAAQEHHRSSPARTLRLGTMPVVSRRRSHDGGTLLSVTVRPPARPGRLLVIAADGTRRASAGELVLGAAPACIQGVGPDHPALTSTS